MTFLKKKNVKDGTYLLINNRSDIFKFAKGVQYMYTIFILISPLCADNTKLS